MYDEAIYKSFQLLYSDSIIINHIYKGQVLFLLHYALRHAGFEGDIFELIFVNEIMFVVYLNFHFRLFKGLFVLLTDLSPEFIYTHLV